VVQDGADLQQGQAVTGVGREHQEVSQAEGVTALYQENLCGERVRPSGSCPFEVDPATQLKAVVTPLDHTDSS
jgi:hypothetical protein